MTRARDADFESQGLRAGVWTGRLTAAAAPGRVLLVHQGQPVARGALAPSGPDAWTLTVALPPEVLGEGVQTLVLLADDATGDGPPAPGAQRLGALSLIAGEALEDDLRAELDLLRAEVDLLKRELRRLARATDTTADTTGG